MNIFTLKIFDDEARRCTFYTVTKDGHELSETEKFFMKFRQGEFKRSVQELAKFMEIVIGEVHGAREHFFRHENDAKALPPSGQYAVGEMNLDYSDFPLRLYCLRISDQLVVLFHGGRKTSENAQEGDTGPAFRDANTFARKIVRTMIDRELRISADGRHFEDENGNSNDIDVY